MARSNGGIIGVSNKTSFGKCVQTVKTSTGNVTTQSGTRIVKTLLVAGGGGGGRTHAAGGGGGGLRIVEVPVCGSTAVPVVVGAGGAGGTSPVPAPADNPGSNGSVSSITGNDCTTVSAAGGGGGGGGNAVGVAGGSGGGSSPAPG